MTIADAAPSPPTTAVPSTTTIVLSAQQKRNMRKRKKRESTNADTPIIVQERLTPKRVGRQGLVEGQS